MQLQRKLDFSLRQNRGGDYARGSRTVRDIGVGLCENRVVEGVEKLRPELQCLMLGDSEKLAERQVAADPSRTDEDILSGVSKGVSRRRRFSTLELRLPAGSYECAKRV